MILFVFEGGKAEPTVFDSIGKLFLPNEELCVVKCRHDLPQQEVLEATDCFLMRAKLLECLEGFTGRPGDAAWCEKIRNEGYRVVYDPYAVLYEDR